MIDEGTAPSAGQIDVARLPDDVAALIEALQPGEEVVITRAGVPIATIAGARRVLEGDIVVLGAADEDTERSATDYDNVTVVATAMKLPESARALLSAQLGADYIVVDMHAAPVTTDVVLAPPSSPQLIGHLRQMFPQARIVVTEIDDERLGVSYQGPIGRMLDAGAETYLTPTTIPLLARQLDHAVTRRPAVAGRLLQPREIPPSTGGGELDS